MKNTGKISIENNLLVATVPTFKKGDKVKTVYGNIEEVCRINGNQIFTYESIVGNHSWHPTKIHKI